MWDCTRNFYVNTNDLRKHIGIVPHNIIPKYCEGMFPPEYGRVVDYMHVYDEEMQKFGDQIIWLPMEQAELKQE